MSTQEGLYVNPKYSKALYEDSLNKDTDFKKCSYLNKELHFLI